MKPKAKPLTVWVGECVCGSLVYETADGKRFDYGTQKPHHEWACKSLREQRDRADI